MAQSSRGDLSRSSGGEPRPYPHGSSQLQLTPGGSNVFGPGAGHVKVSFNSKSATLRFGNMTCGQFLCHLIPFLEILMGLEKTWLEQGKR